MVLVIHVICFHCCHNAFYHFTAQTRTSQRFILNFLYTSATDADFYYQCTWRWDMLILSCKTASLDELLGYVTKQYMNYFYTSSEAYPS